MAGDNAVRLLLEKMTQCASRAYMSILERLLFSALICIKSIDIHQIKWIFKYTVCIGFYIYH